MDQPREETGNEPKINPQGQTEQAATLWQKGFDIFGKSWRLKGALIILVLLAGMYGWRNLSLRKIEKETRKQTQQMAATTSRQLQAKNRALMRMTAIPLSWVVRMEMPKGNYDNIDQYFTQILKEDHFKVILLADTKGKILVATDRRMEGASLSQYYDAPLLELYQTTVSELDNKDLIAATPVMGLTAKLGVLLMVYPHQTEEPLK